MVNSKYANAYKEVLNVIGKLNKDDFDKIPKKYIEFFEANCNNEYNFIYDNTKSFGEQELLDDTKYILFCLFEKFGATDIQKAKIKSYKDNYSTKLEEQKREKYNPNDIFKNRNRIVPQEEQLSEETRITIVQEEKWYQKIFNFVKGIFYRNKQD